MEILGLDKIRKISDNTDLESDVKGLDMVRAEEEFVNITGLDSIRNIFTNDFPKLSAFAMELLKTVARAKELDTELRQYGASNHRYEFAPVAALSQVRSFEQRHNIKLPQAYVEYLTQAGNGGAGPELGLYSLDELEFRNFYAHSNRNVAYPLAKAESDYYSFPFAMNDIPPLISPYLSEQEWDSACLELSKLDSSSQRDIYENKRRTLYNGILQIADCEHSFCPVLVCSGEMSGEIIEFSHDLDMPKYTGKPFDLWLLGYFEDVISKFRKS